MANFEVVQSLEATDDLDEVMPNHFFTESGIWFLFQVDELKNVATIGIFHDDAKRVGSVFKKGFFVANDIGMIDGCEDADLVESIFFFFTG